MTALLDKVGSYTFLAEPFHCDFSQHLFMGHLGNNMLNAADYHSTERGYGMNYLNPQHKTWVLSRLAIEMERMPKAYEKFVVSTWVENAMRYFTSRNFSVTDESGQAFGYGRSIWAMIDTDSRQPVNILDVKDGLIKSYIDQDKACPIDKPSRVQIEGDCELVKKLVMQYSDVDVNGHVNSVKYIQHVLDMFPIEWYEKHRLHRIEVAYVAESHEGDVLHIYQSKISDLEYTFKLMKGNGSDGNLIEIVRSKVIFVNN